MAGKKDETFEVGEIVQLKSGGPKMTVDSTSIYDGKVFCQWFTGGKINMHQFEPGMLIKVEDDEKKPSKSK